MTLGPARTADCADLIQRSPTFCVAGGGGSVRQFSGSFSQRKPRDLRRAKSHASDDMPKADPRIQVDQTLQRGQGFRLAAIDDRNATGVPAAPVIGRALAGECRGFVYGLEDTPSCHHQEKTLCSMRPGRSSTSRAPILVSAYLSGTAPPNPNCGCESEKSLLSSTGICLSRLMLTTLPEAGLPEKNVSAEFILVKVNLACALSWADPIRISSESAADGERLA